MSKEQVCTNCGNAFMARRVDSQHCSRRCANVFRQRAFRTVNPKKYADTRRKWRAENPEKVCQQKQRFLATHPGWDAARQAKRRADDPDRWREYFREWRNNRKSCATADLIALQISKLGKDEEGHGNL